jgi:hypothetical protein
MTFFVFYVYTLICMVQGMTGTPAELPQLFVPHPVVEASK